ncbi:MAG: hypothetical protein O8C63_00010 [Candidatus Methanoperedens sp.]|nr:hypothetical protein [Candidatus Methanoperedens sp.]
MQKMERMSGTFLSKGKEIYFFYTTCPKCAEYYGKSYMVLPARFRSTQGNHSWKLVLS